jgi:hypothetical protein
MTTVPRAQLMEKAMSSPLAGEVAHSAGGGVR